MAMKNLSPKLDSEPWISTMALKFACQSFPRASVSPEKIEPCRLLDFRAGSKVGRSQAGVSGFSRDSGQRAQTGDFFYFSFLYRVSAWADFP